MHDVIIIGGGPAGLSAALTLRARGKSVWVVSNDPVLSPLAKAQSVDNYPGVLTCSGTELLNIMTKQAEAAGAERALGRALSVMPAGDTLYVSVGPEVHQAAAMIIATGIVRGKPFPGESELLGAGVSYCATCDGMLYRGKRTAVLGLSADAEEEAEFLRSIGCEVTFFDKTRLKDCAILGEGRVEALRCGGEEHPCEAVFILRDTIAPSALVPGLELDGNHIRVGRDMSTNVPGVFAAGDCVGAPYQVAKATGEGNIAALSAAAYIDKRKKQ